jgi:type IV secretory pathway VirB10-like protein
MSEPKNQIESPSGLDFNPSPPPTARVSKKVGLVAIGIVLGVGTLVVYGLYTRKEQQTVTRQANQEKRPEPARIAGDQMVREIAPPAVVNPPAAPAGRQEFGSADSTDGAPELTLRPPSITHRQDGQERGNGRSSGNGTSIYSSSAGELSPEERLRLAAFREEQQAIASPTGIAGNSLVNAGTPSSRESDPLQQYGALASLLSSIGKQNPIGQDVQSLSSSTPQTGSAYEGQNGQSQKDTFLQKTRGRTMDTYLKSTRTEPLSRYEIKAGWDIPATLEQGIDSDLPGEVKALVRSNVYDTATGEYLLIPQGARLLGTYNSLISYGQARVQVVWTRIIFPDASSINLDGMSGHDDQGRAGFHDQVNNHYARLVGFAVLTSAFAAGLELSQRQNTSLLTTPTAGQTASAAVGQQLTELGSEVTRRNLNIQPTIKIRVGYKFTVRVNRDMLFDAPYKPVEMR